MFPHLPGERLYTSLEVHLALLLLLLLPLFVLSSSTASVRAQWAPPDFNSMSFRPQLRAPHLSGHCRTSTASSRSQWAVPDLIREPELSGHCGISTASARSQWALPDLNCELHISVGTSHVRENVGINAR